MIGPSSPSSQSLGRGSVIRLSSRSDYFPKAEELAVVEVRPNPEHLQMLFEVEQAFMECVDKCFASVGTGICLRGS